MHHSNKITHINIGTAAITTHRSEEDWKHELNDQDLSSQKEKPTNKA
jgi:hypothetical protein